jgi:predicted dehydrogenase
VLKIAIVGCGKIADAHALQIQMLDGCELIAVCDRELLMAKQLQERFNVKYCFTDCTDLIQEARPDVVHITTPPGSHFHLASFCLENGCHVYVEKPFTLNAEEAEQLIELANRKGVKLTAGHNYQFTHAARRMRELVRGGYLGHGPIHMESYYCYDFGDPSYARALLGDSSHWIRRLPGRLLHNIISHGIARIAEFITTDNPTVIAHGFISSFLKGIGETEIVDELRVTISDADRTTAYFTFSSQMRPTLHEFRIYGSNNGLVLDQNHEIVLKLRGAKFKSYMDHFIPPLLFARQYLNNFMGNAKLFWHRDFQMDSGMAHLIQEFYGAIRDGTSLPITYREIILTAKIMDNIFRQLDRSHNDLALQTGSVA